MAAVGPHLPQHEEARLAAVGQRVEDRLGLEHLGQVRELRERGREVVHAAEPLVAPPEVVRAAGQQRVGGDRHLLHPRPVVALERLEGRVVGDLQLEGLRRALLRDRHADAPSLLERLGQRLAGGGELQLQRLHPRGVHAVLLPQVALHPLPGQRVAQALPGRLQPVPRGRQQHHRVDVLAGLLRAGGLLKESHRPRVRLAGLGNALGPEHREVEAAVVGHVGGRVRQQVHRQVQGPGAGGDRLDLLELRPQVRVQQLVADVAAGPGVHLVEVGPVAQPPLLRQRVRAARASGGASGASGGSGGEVAVVEPVALAGPLHQALLQLDGVGPGVAEQHAEGARAGGLAHRLGVQEGGEDRLLQLAVPQAQRLGLLAPGRCGAPRAGLSPSWRPPRR